jgi:hypothetical protein
VLALVLVAKKSARELFVVCMRVFEKKRRGVAGFLLLVLKENGRRRKRTGMEMGVAVVLWLIMLAMASVLLVLL